MVGGERRSRSGLHCLSRLGKRAFFEKATRPNRYLLDLYEKVVSSSQVRGSTMPQSQPLIQASERQIRPVRARPNATASRLGPWRK